MNVKYFFLIYFLLLSCSIFSQNNQSLFKFEEKIKISEKEKKTIPKEVLKNIEAKMLWSPATLYYKQGRSVYVIEDKEIKDLENSDRIKKQSIVYSKKMFFKDYKKNNLKSQVNYKFETVIINEPLLSFKWKLINETKLINGIKCYKAITKTEREGDVIAWYTDFFGIQDGPQKFFGLPGLIVYLEHDFMAYRLKKATENKNFSMPVYDKKAYIVNREQYDKEFVNADKNVTLKNETIKNKTNINIRGKSFNIGKKN